MAATKTTGRRPRLTRRREDYLEAVFELVRRDGFARVRDIARRTGVSKSSVTAALRQLSRAELVHYDPYQMVTLTARGEALAREVRRRHNTIRDFLREVLSIDPETAEANACRMEHVVDEKVLHRLSMLAEFVQDRPDRGGEWLGDFLAFCRAQDSRESPPAAADLPASRRQAARRRNLRQESKE